MADRNITTEKEVGFRCRFPNHCDCCPHNRSRYDFVVTALGVVERRRDELKDEVTRLRAAIQRVNDFAVHLNGEGRDPDAKFYSKRDVETLIAITRATEKYGSAFDVSANLSTKTE